MLSIKLSESEIRTLFTSLLMSHERFEDMRDEQEQAIKELNYDKQKASDFRRVLESQHNDIRSIWEKLRVVIDDKEGAYDMETLMRISGYRKRANH